jgi:cytoskeletal protein CcmA (bactofilin family)
VRCASLNISKYGTVAGTIVARDVTVSGGVSGSIFAERLVLKPACDVEGEICYRELALEDGSYFEGKSKPHQRPLDMAEPKRQ